MADKATAKMEHGPLDGEWRVIEGEPLELRYKSLASVDLTRPDADVDVREVVYAFVSQVGDLRLYRYVPAA